MNHPARHHDVSREPGSRVRSRNSAYAVIGVVILSLGATLTAAAGVAGGVVTACYNTTNGNLRIETSTAPCKLSEERLTWDQFAQQGEKGEKGDTGERGPKGDTGERGPIGPSWAVVSPLEVDAGTLSIAEGGIDTALIDDGAVTSDKLSTALTTEITALRAELTSAQAAIGALDLKFAQLASGAAGGPTVASSRITGLTIGTYADGGLVTPTAGVDLAPGETGVFSIEVVGIEPGDMWVVHKPEDVNFPAGLLIVGSAVSSAGMLTVTVYNSTGGDVAEGSGFTNWRVRWLDLTP